MTDNVMKKVELARMGEILNENNKYPNWKSTTLRSRDRKLQAQPLLQNRDKRAEKDNQTRTKDHKHLCLNRYQRMKT